jgi:hypothetical protein
MPQARRVGEAEQACVQSLTGKGGDPRTGCAGTGAGAPGACAVERIADQRVATIGKMDSDLMRPAGSKTAFDECGTGLERALDTIARDRRLSSVLPDDGHLLTVDGAAADVRSNLARRRCRHPPNKRSIGAVDPA